MHCILQGEIQWVEVNESIFLYDINVSSAVENIYGVALRHADGESGPIHWTDCLYDSSQRLYSVIHITYTYNMLFSTFSFFSHRLLMCNVTFLQSFTYFCSTMLQHSMCTGCSNKKDPNLFLYVTSSKINGF